MYCLDLTFRGLMGSRPLIAFGKLESINKNRHFLSTHLKPRYWLVNVLIIFQCAVLWCTKGVTNTSLSPALALTKAAIQMWVLRQTQFFHILFSSISQRSQVLCHSESVLYIYVPQRQYSVSQSASVHKELLLCAGATGAFIFHPPLHSQSSARIATELVSTNFSLSLCAILLSRAPPYTMWTT